MSNYKTAKDYLKAIKKLKDSGLSGSPSPNRITGNIDTIPDLDKRISFLLGVVNNEKRKATDMIFLVMYDIENDKVRRYVAKYLEQQGCMRVQRSIFLADLDVSMFKEIKEDLTDVQASYANEDSIMVVPLPSDSLKSMCLIGKNIHLDIITRSKSTLFF